jgi:hypothetical protein
MRRISQQASKMGRAQSRRRAAVVTLLLVCTVSTAGALAQSRDDRRLEEARRKEGEALVNLADTAMSGRAASDFALQWSNDFFKAQSGTFVPFTVTVDRSKLTAASALMYVRAARREAPAAARGRGFVRYPFDIIFPIDVGGALGPSLRITRGFAVPPGEYDVYVALRERAADPLAEDQRLKAAVLKQPLSVPDFWTGELTTSTVILADHIDVLPGSIGPDELLERPYVIGQNEVHPAPAASFRRDRELIVVFLIYNPAVSAEKRFDIQVDYHLFRRVPGTPAEGSAASADHPPARAGERYVTRTNPQRFTPLLMGAMFDPAAGHPMLAGQGILLSSFQEGEYRLGITVTDLLSRKTLSRDVTFTVLGS